MEVDVARGGLSIEVGSDAAQAKGNKAFGRHD
jgi:hypothetical protein